MSRCPNCHILKSKTTVLSVKDRSHSQKSKRDLKNEYGLVEVVYGNWKADDYMMQIVFRNEEKTKRM